jgi:pyruvate,water dikinase
MTTWVRWFDGIGMNDVPAVGGKNASLGERVVQGTVNLDEFYVFKPTLAKGFRPILQKQLGTLEQL